MKLLEEDVEEGKGELTKSISE